MSGNAVERMAAGMARTKRPCVHCGREIVASGMATHEPACAPEAREARRLKHIEYSRRYSEAHKSGEPQRFLGWTIPDAYRSRPSDLEACPTCGGPKTIKAALCVRCRIAVGKRRRPVADRFWEKVDRSGGPDVCWPWTGAVSHGYGRFQMRGTNGDIASRVAYRLSVGNPGELDVLHHCDNPPCCNPAHLFLGTAADNMADMISKGRGAWQKTA